MTRHRFEPRWPESPICVHICSQGPDHPDHAITPAEVHTGISDRAAAALVDVTNLRRLTRGLAFMGLPDLSAELDRIEQALHADGGA